MANHRMSSAIRPTDDGYVTAETAVVFPVLVVVLVVVLWILSLASAHTRASDIAQRTARSAARGDSWESLRAAVRLTDPRAVVEIDEVDDLVVVRVHWAEDSPVPFLRDLARVEVHGDATARVELLTS